MIDGAPEIMLDAIYPNEHLIEMPAPKKIEPSANALFTNLCGENRAEAVPPKADSLVADVDALFE